MTSLTSGLRTVKHAATSKDKFSPRHNGKDSRRSVYSQYYSSQQQQQNTAGTVDAAQYHSQCNNSDKQSSTVFNAQQSTTSTNNVVISTHNNVNLNGSIIDKTQNANSKIQRKHSSNKSSTSSINRDNNNNAFKKSILTATSPKSPIQIEEGMKNQTVNIS